MSGAGAPFLLLGDGEERPFDAALLERELRSMWKGSREGTAFYRAALANIIVPLAPNSESLPEVIAEVCRRHPARLFRIQPRSAKSREPQLSARASALCYMRSGGTGFVCSEQIIIEWSAETASLVPSAIGALLIGDLPVVLLSLQAAPGASWSTLHDRADLIIADSCAEEEPALLPSIWERTGRRGAPMRDLAWARIAPWRALIAELFDSPEGDSTLAALRDVTLTHGGAAPPSTAWLLAGWIASRLGWRVLSRDGHRWRLQGPNAHIDVTLTRDESVSSPVIGTVQLRAAGAHPLDVRLAHRHGDPTVRVEWLAPRASSSESPFVFRDLAAAIVGEMQRLESNPAFRDAAHFASIMIRS